MPCHFSHLRQFGALALAAWLGLASHAEADLFVLTSGGQIQGEWLNRESSGPTYQIRFDSGDTVAISRQQVKEVVRHRPALADYEEIAPTYQDTIEDHWKLADWCRQKGLTSQREQHLRRIIELDETVHQAWRALGYSHVSGRWVAKGDVPRENGMTFYKGRWRLQQEIQVLEEHAAVKRAEQDWQTRLKRLRNAILDGDRPQSAYAELRAIRDPNAVTPLSQFLANESVRSLNLIYVETLAKINSSGARQALITASLQHRDPEVFHACVEELLRVKTPAMVELSTKALRDENNERVNRAAYVLGRLGDSSAIGPLIDALVTKHTVIVPGSGKGGATTASFGKATDSSGQTVDGGPAISRSSGPTSYTVRIPNQEVLHSLGKLAGDASFGFDISAWKNWYGVRKQGLPTPQNSQARRDPAP
jgi:hypothetical protein